MTHTNGAVTISDVLCLSAVVGAAMRTARVARAYPDGNVVYGTARNIGDESGNYISVDADVRDAYLRVTLQSGFDAYWRVSALAAEVADGTFCEYDWM